MPNRFIALDVPVAANGTGAPVDVSDTGHPKTFVLTGPVTGRYVVEGSNDGGKTWDILVDDNDGTQVLFTSQNSGVKTVDCVVGQVRVRSIRALTTGTPPTITMGVPPALGTNSFGTLDVPAASGSGAVLDLGLSVGPLKTFVLRGAVPERGRFTVLASMDGVRFDEAMLFTADQQGARSVHVICRFLRVLRGGASGSPPVVAVGAEGLLETGSENSTFASDQTSVDDSGEHATSRPGQEEVLAQFTVPVSQLASTSQAVTFSGLSRRREGAGKSIFRVRLGGQPDQPDGELLALVEDNAPGDKIVSVVGAAFNVPTTNAVLLKVTGEGQGDQPARIQGIAVAFQPAT